MKENKDTAGSADEKTEKNKKTAKSKKELTPEQAEKKAEKKRFLRRRFRYGGAAAAITVVITAVVVLINIVMTLLSDRVNMSIDITPDKLFEISQETVDYLNTLNEPVEITCMTDELEFSTSTYVFFKQAYEVLRKYTIYSDNITLRFVDMTKDPTYANKFKEMYKGDISQYSIVVSSDKRIKVISVQDLYNVEMNYYTYSQEIKSSKAEQELTSAIMYVTDPDPINAVVFNSESSGSSYDNVYDLLVSNGYNVSEINPLIDEIPEDADLIVLNAPQNDYSEDVVQKIYEFLDNDGKLGKNLIYIANYNQNSTANIDALLSEWGIKIGTGVVGDSDSANTSSSTPYFIGSLINTDDNEFAANVSDTSLPVISNYSRPIELLFDAKDNRKTKALITTADTSFVMTEELQQTVQNGGNADLSYGSEVTMAVGRKYIFDDNNKIVYSNVLAVGSADMLGSSLTGASYYNNGDYFISALNTMTGKTEGISIVAKDLTSKTFDINEQTYKTCRFVFLFVIPLAVVVCGVVVYFRRRSK